MTSAAAEARLDPLALAVDLLRARAESFEDPHGERQGHFPFPRECLLGPGPAEARHLEGRVRPGEDTDVGIELFGLADDLLVDPARAGGEDEIVGPGDPGTLEDLGAAGMGALQKGEDNLAGTRRPTVAVISGQRATALGVTSGDQLRISNSHGSITVPALVDDIHDDAIWLPRNSFASQTLGSLDAVHGDVVTVVKA